MKFIPYDNKVQINPIKSEVWGSSELIEKGIVVSVGKGCKFLKVGDTVFFESWGIGKTPPSIEGDESTCIYTLEENPKFILGKYANRKK